MFEIVEQLDAPAIIVSFVAVVFVFRAFIELNDKLIDIVKSSTSAMNDLTAAFHALREEVKELRRAL